MSVSVLWRSGKQIKHGEHTFSFSLPGRLSHNTLRHRESSPNEWIDGKLSITVIYSPNYVNLFSYTFWIQMYSHCFLSAVSWGKLARQMRWWLASRQALPGSWSPGQMYRTWEPPIHQEKHPIPGVYSAVCIITRIVCSLWHVKQISSIILFNEANGFFPKVLHCVHIFIPAQHKHHVQLFSIYNWDHV